MKPGTSGRRPRGRPNRKQHGGPPRPNNFDSNGPEGRVRGNAHQVYERYLAMARDALSAGDRIAAETYYQHAEHYFRVLNASTDPQPNGQGRPDRRGPPPQHDGQRTNMPQDGAQPGTSAANGQEPAQQPAQQPTRQEHRGRQHRPQPSVVAPVAPPMASPVAPQTSAANGDRSGHDDPERPVSKPSGGCEPAGV